MTVLIIGATSDIAQHMAQIYARRNAALILAVRNEDAGVTLGRRLFDEGASSVDVVLFGATFKNTHQVMIDTAWGIAHHIDTVVIAHGVLPDQSILDTQPDEALDVFLVNGLSTMSIMQRAAIRLAQQGGGTLAVLSSVAGERGRRSTYTYGAAKAAVTHFSAGLRARWAAQKVHVVTIKPGPVRTRMTAHRKDMPMMAEVVPVAQAIVKAIDSRKKVVYVPGIWRYIMAVVRLLPESVMMKVQR